MWKWLKKPPQDESHLLYWLCYWQIGTEDGWIYCKSSHDQLEFSLCCEILRRLGYIKWQKV